MDRLFSDQDFRIMRAATYPLTAHRMGSIELLHLDVSEEPGRNLLLRFIQEIREIQLQLQREGTAAPAQSSRTRRRTTTKDTTITQQTEPPARACIADSLNQTQKQSEREQALVILLLAMLLDCCSHSNSLASSIDPNPRRNNLLIDTLACAEGPNLILSSQGDSSKGKRRYDLDPYSPTLSTSSIISEHDYPHNFS